MYNFEEFTERYKKLSNAQLLEILEHPAHYQPIALEAAKQEFKYRLLTADQILEAKQELNEKEWQKEKLHERNEVIKEKLINTGNTLFDTLNPVQNSSPTVNKAIGIISTVFGVIGIFSIVNYFDLIKYYISDGAAFSFEFALILFPVLLIFSGVVLFLFRKQTGWIFLVFYCSYSLFPAIWFLIKSVMQIMMGTAYDSYFFQPTPMSYIVAVLFFLACIYVFGKANMRAVYKISDEAKWGTMLTGLSLGALLIFL